MKMYSVWYTTWENKYKYVLYAKTDDRGQAFRLRDEANKDPAIAYVAIREMNFNANTDFEKMSTIIENFNYEHYEIDSPYAGNEEWDEIALDGEIRLWDVFSDDCIALQFNPDGSFKGIDIDFTVRERNEPFIY